MWSIKDFFMKMIQKIPIRAWIIAMIFMTSFMSSALASNISYIIPYMTNHPKMKRAPFCNVIKEKSEWIDVVQPDYGPRFNWSAAAKRQIQVAFFYGIAIASPPAGILAEWLGPKNTILWPLLFAGIINILSAFGARWGWGVPLACRFIVGLASGTVFPALQCLVGRWAPPHEKGKFLNAIMGSSIGTSFIWIMIRASSPVLGWPWAFYILSILITIYCASFWYLTASNPEEHKFIRKEEIEYIRASQHGSVSLTKQLPPFKDILTSPQCWALSILNFGSYWGINLQTQVVPMFIEKYMGITAHESVLLDILPQIARFSSAIVFGNLSDFIRKRNMMSCTVMSKIYVVFSHLIPGFIMMSLGAVKCNAPAACILLTLSNLFTGATVGGGLRNPTDLSPNFAGTIYGLNMCLAQTTGFIVPHLSGWILGDKGGIIQWTIVFLIGGGAYFGTGVIYLWFGSAEVQSWNAKKEREPNQEYNN